MQREASNAEGVGSSPSSALAMVDVLLDVGYDSAASNDSVVRSRGMCELLLHSDGFCVVRYIVVVGGRQPGHEGGEDDGAKRAYHHDESIFRNDSAAPMGGPPTLSSERTNKTILRKFAQLLTVMTKHRLSDLCWLGTDGATRVRFLRGRPGAPKRLHEPSHALRAPS